MEAEIPSSADYLCTSSRDSFHCNGAKSREASGAKPTEKCFYLARLSSLLKVRFFWESHELRAQVGEPTLRFVKKRLWSLNDDIPCFLLYFLSLFFAIPRRYGFSLAFWSNGSRDSYEGWSRWREEYWGGGGKWEKLRQLPADFGIWSMDYVPPRMLIPLPFIERRFRNDATG